MKKFSRHRTLTEIRELCADQGVPLNTTLYDESGWDSVRVGTPGMGHVIFNTFNGNFFGSTPRGIDFESWSTKHESRSWFQALLNFFYVSEVAA